MNTIRLMISALTAASAIACFAEPAAPPSAIPPKTENGPRRPRMEQRSRDARPETESNRRRDLWVGEGLDGIGGQSMMLRMLDNPEISARLGIQPELRDTILECFKKIDDTIAAHRTTLFQLQRNQAKLMAERASKEAVMEAVDQVWKCRGEIAKLQTAKVLELQKHLTDEQIKKIDAVRAEEFRTRRLRQLREGDRQSKNDDAPRDRKAPEKPQDDKSPEGK